MIQVLKRDGTREPFDPHKLAGALARVIKPNGGTHRNACDLAGAMHLYVRRACRHSISSSAVFEMVIKVLRRVGFVAAAEGLEAHRIWRQQRRGELRIRHDSGQVTRFDRTWLAELASRSWHISPAAARIIAGDVENELLRGSHAELRREDVVELLNTRMAQFGLADAVPAGL
jgi:hypothetical protein